MVVPYDPSYASNLACLFCGKLCRPTPEDFLTHADLGVAREVRPAQIQLTNLIEDKLLFGGITLIEAGTGVGKSFAYLLPAILSGKRTLITTAKKSLQSQLFEKDLPFLQDVLREQNITFKYAMAYGKSNYVCKYAALRRSKKEIEGWRYFEQFEDTWTWEALDSLKKKKNSKKLEVLRFDSDLTAEGCIGRPCSYFDNGCTYTADRKDVSEADVVVTNHWLFGYHLKLMGTLGFALLGAFKNVVVDEAHKLEDGLRTAFTDSISDQKLYKLISAYENAVLGDGREFPKKKELLAGWRNMLSSASALADKNDSSVSVADYTASALCDALAGARTVLEDLKYASDVIGSGDDPQFKQIFQSFIAGHRTSADDPRVGFDYSNYMSDDVRSKWASYRIVYRELLTLHKLVLNAVSHTVNDNFVTYIDRNSKSNQISVSPIELGAYMQVLYKDPAQISIHFLSATLAVNGSMDVFARRMGLDPRDSRVSSAMIGSAFNIKKQATLYIARDVPEPARDARQEEYRNKLSDQIFALTEANGGNAFVLFTARDEMLHVANDLSSRASNPILVQDNISASDLLKQYRATDGAVLLGLKSFWEGVDVAGEKLSLVIITKLPFPGRSDPIVNARRAKVGAAWFHYVDIPDMIFDLRQGVGRLIRTTTDKGMVAILDSRILTKPYGKTVVRSTGFSQAHTDINNAIKAIKM